MRYIGAATLLMLHRQQQLPLMTGQEQIALCRVTRCADVLQAIVRAVRNARAEYGVELGRKIAATVLIRGDEALR